MTEFYTDIPTVSIVTITQLKRHKSFQLLIEMIQSQTYQNIVEWIIVEGSPCLEKACENETLLKGLIAAASPPPPPVRYIPFTGKKLGGLRNLGNENVTGDIVVCFDDDDYYPPVRIEHAVKKLSSSTENTRGCLIAGVSEVFLYDFYLDELIQFKSFGQYHSTNSAMAYKKEYLEKNSYEETAFFGEEYSFTKGFTEPMIQLNPYETVVVISHEENTVCKKPFYYHRKTEEYGNSRFIDIEILSIIPVELYYRMYDNFVSNFDMGINDHHSLTKTAPFITE
jgi:glycosyltransferase involved in cell wall biosynthesis